MKLDRDHHHGVKMGNGTLVVAFNIARWSSAKRTVDGA
jgi:hypothetical protein